jgi:hypothetical protein
MYVAGNIYVASKRPGRLFFEDAHVMGRIPEMVQAIQPKTTGFQTSPEPCNGIMKLATNNTTQPIPASIANTIIPFNTAAPSSPIVSVQETLHCFK